MVPIGLSMVLLFSWIISSLIFHLNKFVIQKSHIITTCFCQTVRVHFQEDNIIIQKILKYFEFMGVLNSQKSFVIIFVFSFDDILRYWHVNAFLLHPLFLLKTNKQHLHEFEEGYLNN